MSVTATLESLDSGVAATDSDNKPEPKPDPPRRMRRASKAKAGAHQTEVPAEVLVGKIGAALQDEYPDDTGDTEAGGATQMLIENQDPEPFAPVVRLPAPRRALKEQLLEYWEGTVTEVTDSTFSAQLEDVMNPDAPAQEVVGLRRSTLSDDDMALLQEGAVFYWSIVTCKRPTGERVTENRIRFRRIPAWTDDDESKAEANAQRFADLVARSHDSAKQQPA